MQLIFKLVNLRFQIFYQFLGILKCPHLIYTASWINFCTIRLKGLLYWTDFCRKCIIQMSAQVNATSDANDCIEKLIETKTKPKKNPTNLQAIIYWHVLLLTANNSISWQKCIFLVYNGSRKIVIFLPKTVPLSLVLPQNDPAYSAKLMHLHIFLNKL